MEQEHLEYMKWLDSLDRNYAHDAPEGPIEAKWLEDRMKEILSGGNSDTNENLPF